MLAAGLPARGGPVPGSRGWDQPALPLAAVESRAAQLRDLVLSVLGILAVLENVE